MAKGISVGRRIDGQLSDYVAVVASEKAIRS